MSRKTSLRRTARGRLERLVRPGEKLTWAGVGGLGWVIEFDRRATELGSSYSSSACSSGDPCFAKSNTLGGRRGQEVDSAVPILRIESFCSHRPRRRPKRNRVQKRGGSFSNRSNETQDQRPRDRCNSRRAQRVDGKHAKHTCRAISRFAASPG